MLHRILTVGGYWLVTVLWVCLLFSALACTYNHGFKDTVRLTEVTRAPRFPSNVVVTDNLFLPGLPPPPDGPVVEGTIRADAPRPGANTVYLDLPHGSVQISGEQDESPLMAWLVTHPKTKIRLAVTVIPDLPPAGLGR